MRLLLDTHALLWLIDDDARLSAIAKEAIFDSEYAAISVVSPWEIAIKQSIGKLQLRNSIEEIAAICMERGVEVIGIEYRHLDAMKALPMVHRDPFDRLLVTTAQCEGMAIATKDENIAKYEVQTVWK